MFSFESCHSKAYSGQFFSRLSISYDLMTVLQVCEESDVMICNYYTR